MGTIYTSTLMNVGNSTSLTRIADTVTYSSGDLIANSTTAGAVTPWTMPVGAAAPFGSSYSNLEIVVRRLKLRRSKADTANANFRVHLLTAAPTFANGDNLALSMSGSAGYVGAVDIATDQLFTDGAVGFGVPNVGGEIVVSLPFPAANFIYAVLEARAAVAPASGETFQLTLETILGQ